MVKVDAGVLCCDISFILELFVGVLLAELEAGNLADEVAFTTIENVPLESSKPVSVLAVKMHRSGPLAYAARKRSGGVIRADSSFVGGKTEN